MPLISVIVPVYKVEEYLSRCIDSILSQTYSDFELILVDDGSPDQCPEICDEYAKKDERIKVIHKKNGGLSDARNAGLDWVFSNSNSEWIIFIDSDDWIHPKTFESLYKVANELSVNVSVTDYKKVTALEEFEDYETISAKLMESEDYYLTSKSSMIACAKLYKKDCFRIIRYPVGKIHEDEFVTYKIVYAQPTVAVVDKPLYYYYTNPNGIMNSEWSIKHLDCITAFEEQIHFFKKYGYKKSYFKTLIKNITLLVDAFEMIGKDVKNNRKSIRLIRRRMKANLMKARIKFSDRKDLYEIAYPKTVSCYWYGVVLVNKIKKFLEK